jgi:hypothetical protein
MSVSLPKKKTQIKTEWTMVVQRELVRGSIGGLTSASGQRGKKAKQSEDIPLLQTLLLCKSNWRCQLIAPHFLKTFQH